MIIVGDVEKLGEKGMKSTMKEVETLLKRIEDNSSILLKNRLRGPDDLLVLDSQNCVQDALQILAEAISDKTLSPIQNITRTVDPSAPTAPTPPVICVC